MILDAATYGDTDLQPLKRGFAEVAVHAFTHAANAGDHLVDASVAITNKVVLDRPALLKAKQLRLICVAATGTDNVDMLAAADRGVVVTNVPGYATASTASQTFALYFHLAHHTRYFEDYTRAGKWCDERIFTHLGPGFTELQDQTWGIIGMGAIGTKVAHIAQAFGCRVVYHSTSGANLNQPWTHLPLNELLAAADVVSIHAPLNQNTAGLIGRKQLKLMKKNAILLNTGRGGIVVEEELVDHLDAGGISGAGVDVVSCEPPPPDHVYFKLHHKDRLLLTPHIAWSGARARARLINEVAANIAAFLAKQPRNLVPFPE